MRIITLGSNGWIPTSKSMTTSFLVEYKDKLILLDLGTGVSNIKKHLNVINKYKEIHIILSHYHLDHIEGMIYLNNFFKNHNIFVYAPGKPYYKKGSKKILSELTRSYFFNRKLLNFGRKINFFDYDLNGFYIDNIPIYINEQIHTNYSFGINIDNILHFATDTEVFDETFSIAKNSKLLLHECWSINPTLDLHSSLVEIIDMYEKFKVDNILLIHQNPNWNNKDRKNILSLIENTGIYLSKDNQIIQISL